MELLRWLWHTPARLPALALAGAVLVLIIQSTGRGANLARCAAWDALGFLIVLLPFSFWVLTSFTGNAPEAALFRTAALIAIPISTIAGAGLLAYLKGRR